ncbi:hypothetical protein B0J11DRAFT_597307 [Dendryphion nanum]|uniref:Uncharacterized protein n=1 Tax=Dendryphion nanum TaxID=256645 RepID=A0A9P9EEK4_9PLEO|nr:hypothetical protein B0J11DRAFT_597307 [Dendryphion nanum]
MFKKIFKSRHPVAQPGSPIPPVTGNNGHQPQWQDNEYSSFAPIEYDRSAPSFPRQEENITSLTPVDYVLSPPTHRMPPLTTSAVPVEYPMSPPSAPNPPRAELPENVPEGPVELPGSSVPARYELPVVNSARQTPHIQNTPPSPRPSFNSGSNIPTGRTPLSSSNTTLVNSPRSGLASPTLPEVNVNSKQYPKTSGDKNDGIKKYTVDIYCPLKPDATGIRRQQIPRDVREFRLAKVALIPIVAGKRSFVSLDIVFGELDKAYSHLVEKHFSFCHQTRLTKLDPAAVSGGQVYTIGPLNIAYRDGDREIVYVKFASKAEKDKFKADFFDMWRTLKTRMQFEERTSPSVLFFRL